MAQKEIRFSYSADIPPNPYSLQPVKTRTKLAGRSEEATKIEYYLSLLAEGQNHHLALIGTRGVGKTSLLNTAEIIASECNLLPVRIDLNEQKASAPGTFWMEFYASLLPQLGKFKCWGGTSSDIYAALFTMIHARQTVPLDSVVLQFPYAAATFNGPLDQLYCSDALLVTDLQSLEDELRRRGIKGMVLLIDEADCLGANLPLIQMFRNVFQRHQFSCVVLAGTDAVFPTLSNVFSPIPRQFHRIDIKPFAYRNQTHELIRKPLDAACDNGSMLAPDSETVDELHVLCGGDPAELQLYCHHMYRALEQSKAAHRINERMKLSPAVFRAVLKEYRANAPLNIDNVLNKIEKLPDSLLFETDWLKLRNLSARENAELRILRKELITGKALDEDQRDQIRIETESKYEQLYFAGVTEEKEQLRIKGAPLSSGFWKSYVATEKDSTWSWNDDSFEEVKEEILELFIASQTMASFSRPAVGDVCFSDTIAAVRMGDAITEVFPPEIYLFATLVTANSSSKNNQYVVDATIEFSLDNKRIKRSFLYEQAEEVDIKQRFEHKLEASKALLESHGISLDVKRIAQFDLPSREELRRLAHVAGVYLPGEQFGKSLLEEAIDCHDSGEYRKAAEIFLGMLRDKESKEIRNNAAYCLALDGRFEEALELYNTLTLRNDRLSPLILHNQAVMHYLIGNEQLAKRELKRAFDLARISPSDSLHVHCMMILSEHNSKIQSEIGIAVDAGILINMCLIGEASQESVLERLDELHPGQRQRWECLLSSAVSQREMQ